MDDVSGFTMEDTNVRPPRFSDDGLALEFSRRHDGRLLYVKGWAAWLWWDGRRWAQDTTLAVYDLARIVCRDMAVTAQEEDPKRGDGIGKEITSAGTVAAVERMARSDRRHARAAEDFDADPWILNCAGGVVDLRTGTLRPHRRSDLHTKVAGATPDHCIPWRWLRFLLEITHGDKEVVRYLQRFAGYTATGVTTEHAFLFLNGPGGNGKSVLLSILAAALGDYAVTAMQDTFTATRNDAHPTHVASLRGARMCLVTEVDQGRAWAEARIKSLTGGDKISARVMRGDPFEFTPAFKLWVAANHKPELKNPDAAMRRRLHLLLLTYVPPRKDLDLAEKLLAELPAILGWIVRGAQAWQEKHLSPPAAVTEATDSYFAEQDTIAAWMAERCKREGMAQTSSRALFTDWKAWITARGEDAGTEKKFSAELERYAVKKRTKTGAAFIGLKLQPSESGAW